MLISLNDAVVKPLNKLKTKQEPRFKKQGGWALIDAGFALMIFLGVSFIIARLVPAGIHQWNMASVNSQISEIQSAARTWKGQRTNYTGISLSTLCQDNYVSATVCGSTNDGSAANPWGGNITVAANSNASLIDVSFTNVDENRVNSVGDALAVLTADQCTERSSCDTISVTTSNITLTL